MNKNHNRLIIIPLIIVSLSAAFSLLNTYNSINNTHQTLYTKVQAQQTKRSLLVQMYNAARERSLTLLAMLNESDDFALDDLNQELGAFAREFISARTQQTRTNT